jgi:hypothetical protein
VHSILGGAIVVFLWVARDFPSAVGPTGSVIDGHPSSPPGILVLGLNGSIGILILSKPSNGERYSKAMRITRHARRIVWIGSNNTGLGHNYLRSPPTERFPLAVTTNPAGSRQVDAAIGSNKGFPLGRLGHSELARIFSGPPQPRGKWRWQHRQYDLVQFDDGTIGFVPNALDAEIFIADAIEELFGPEPARR